MRAAHVLTAPPRLAALAIAAYRRSALHRLSHRDGCPCRFIPTCSEYALRVTARDGLLLGGVRALGRVARCGPWYDGPRIDFPIARDLAPGDVHELTGVRLARNAPRGHWRLYLTPALDEYVDVERHAVVDARDAGDDRVIVRLRRPAVLPAAASAAAPRPA